MPNTLAHFGIQGLLARSAVPTADPKVIFLGCMLPDVPWILQRVVLGIVPGLDPYAVRLYVIVQATLFITLVLCGALAALFQSPGRVFGILALGSSLHLLLDALQTKWGNGVHFFAPISWELINFGLFWPEDLITYGLTGFGLGYVLWCWKDAITIEPDFSKWSMRRAGTFVCMLFLYMVLPLALVEGPYVEDNHYVKTLQERSHRIGKPVEFDRTLYEKSAKGDFIHAYGEHVFVRGLQLDHTATVSVRGRFIAPDMIEILAMHEHTPWFRDGGSYVGLLMLAGMWSVALYRHARSSWSGYARRLT